MKVIRWRTYLNVVNQKLLGQRLYLLRPSGRPHQYLSVRSHLLDDLPYLGLEAHVQHAIGLVQDEVRAPVEVRRALLQKINKTAGRRDHYFNTSFQISSLRPLGRTSKDAGVADHGGRSEFVRHFLYLLGKFPGWSKNQDDRSFSALGSLLAVDVNGGGQYVSQCLTGTGMGDCHQIPAAEYDRPALRLYGGGFVEALLEQRLHHVFGEAVLLEANVRMGYIRSPHDYVAFLSEQVDVMLLPVFDVVVWYVEVLAEWLQLRLGPYRRGKLLVVLLVFVLVLFCNWSTKVLNWRYAVLRRAAPVVRLLSKLVIVIGSWSIPIQILIFFTYLFMTNAKIYYSK